MCYIYSCLLWKYVLLACCTVHVYQLISTLRKYIQFSLCYVVIK